VNEFFEFYVSGFWVWLGITFGFSLVTTKLMEFFKEWRNGPAQPTMVELLKSRRVQVLMAMTWRAAKNSPATVLEEDTRLDIIERSERVMSSAPDEHP
jgi:hypothetical protein